MPNESDNKNPAANPQGQPLPQSPMAPTAPQQNEVRNDANNRFSNEESKAIEIEKDIRSGERWLIGISAAGVVLNVVIALIYYGQLREMRKSTNAATSAADTADKTLKEIRAGSTDTHELAIAAGTQADAAKVANVTTREALTSVQRAFIFFVGNASATKVVIDNRITDLNFTLPFNNAGVTPTKNAESRVNWQSFPDGLPTNFNFPDTGSVLSRQFDIPPKAYGNGTFAIPIGYIEAAKQSHTHLFVWGWIAYSDIFANTPRRLSEFCDEIVNIKSVPEDVTNASANITWDLSLCPVHNCFDERCVDYGQMTKAKH